MALNCKYKRVGIEAARADDLIAEDCEGQGVAPRQGIQRRTSLAVHKTWTPTSGWVQGS